MVNIFKGVICAVCGEKLKAEDSRIYFKPRGRIQRGFTCHKDCLTDEAKDKLDVINELIGD